MDEQPNTLLLAIDGWEGPLDLLLSLARAQKVDLREISILALVEQYLAFIRDVRTLRLEIAADYLVMAAWLAYLKSGLLLPREEAPDPDPEELAVRLTLRLQRLDAMRDAGARLMARDRLDRDVFARGMPEGLAMARISAWRAGLYDLLTAYGAVSERNRPAIHVVTARPVMTLEQGIARVTALVGQRIDWVSLVRLLPASEDAAYRRSAMASSFAGALELARQGRIALLQEAPFAPLLMRAA